MSSFAACRNVEARGWAMVEPWLRAHWHIADIVPLFRAERVQMAGCGDFAVHLRDGRSLVVELKTERENKTGNLFLETWSNRAFGRQRGGWMRDGVFDRLVYTFLASREVYVIDFPKLWGWFWEGPGGGQGNGYRYREVAQRVNDQRNLTCGVPVPIADLRAAGLFTHEAVIPAVTDAKGAGAGSTPAGVLAE